jgi:tetratricopeptide (TPR) repeat protein
MNFQETRGIVCSVLAAARFAGLARLCKQFFALCLYGALAQPGLGLTSCAIYFAQGQDSQFESLLKRGFELHRQQQYRQAIRLLEQARTLQPADYFVNLLLGIDHLRLGDARRALQRLESARKTRNNDSTVLGYLAEAHSVLEEFDKAAEVLQFVASQPGATEEDHLNLIRFYLRRFRVVSEELRSTTTGLAYSYRLQAVVLRDRKDPKTVEMLLRARSLEPQMPGLETALGDSYLAEGRWEEAASAFDRARTLNSDDLELMVGEAILAARSENGSKAGLLLSEVGARSQHVLNDAIRNWPASVPMPPDLRRQQGEGDKYRTGKVGQQDPQQLFQQQRWESLVERLRAKPASPMEALWLGDALARLERFTEAIVPLEQAQRETQLKTEASYWLALCYARAAEKSKLQLSKNGRQSPFLHLVNGEVLLRLALDGPSAVAEYRKAADLLQEDPAVWTGLAEAQMLAGDSHGARESGNRALRLDSQRFDALQILGEACLQERDYEAAVLPLQQALQVQPANVRVRLLLGTAYAKSGRQADALPLLESVLSRGYPDEKGTCHYLLGDVLRRLGRTQDSERAFDRAKQLSESFSRSAHRVSSEAQ